MQNKVLTPVVILFTQHKNAHLHEKRPLKVSAWPSDYLSYLKLWNWAKTARPIFWNGLTKRFIYFTVHNIYYKTQNVKAFNRHNWQEWIHSFHILKNLNNKCLCLYVFYGCECLIQTKYIRGILQNKLSQKPRLKPRLTILQVAVQLHLIVNGRDLNRKDLSNVGLKLVGS